jgi:hypothetical protein
VTAAEDRKALADVISRYVPPDLLADALLYVVEEIARRRVAAAVGPFRELFAGGPDTPCRTTWREDPARPDCSAASIECVEVPVDALRDAFHRAGDPR